MSKGKLQWRPIGLRKEKKDTRERKATDDGATGRSEKAIQLDNAEKKKTILEKHWWEWVDESFIQKKRRLLEGTSRER